MASGSLMVWVQVVQMLLTRGDTDCNQQDSHRCSCTDVLVLMVLLPGKRTSNVTKVCYFFHTNRIVRKWKDSERFPLLFASQKRNWGGLFSSLCFTCNTIQLSPAALLKV